MSVPREQWTAEERELDKFVRAKDNPCPVMQVHGTVRLFEFLQDHTKEAVDAMWERIK